MLLALLEAKLPGTLFLVALRRDGGANVRILATVSADLDGARCSEPRALLRSLVVGILLSVVFPPMATFAAPPEPVSTRIVAFGDSTTATAADWTPAITEVYAQCLPRTLAEHGIRAEVINAGIGNTTTRDGTLRFDRDVRGHAPQLVIIQFGINALLDLYAQDVRDVATEQGTPLVDVFAAFEDYGKQPRKAIGDLLLAGDGIHPNDAGQRLVCELLTPGIAAALARTER